MCRRCVAIKNAIRLCIVVLGGSVDLICVCQSSWGRISGIYLIIKHDMVAFWTLLDDSLALRLSQPPHHYLWLFANQQ